MPLTTDERIDAAYAHLYRLLDELPPEMLLAFSRESPVLFRQYQAQRKKDAQDYAFSARGMPQRTLDDTDRMLEAKAAQDFGGDFSLALRWFAEERPSEFSAYHKGTRKALGLLD